MSSSRPYRSKILSFVLDQFQQGAERHRRAMRQLESVAVMGAQLAQSMAMSIVYAVQRAARLAGRQLGQVMPQVALPDWLEPPPPTSEETPFLAANGGDSIPQVLAVAVQCLDPVQKAQLKLETSGLRLRLGQLLTPKTASLQQGYPDQLQGIASDIETRTIVLVGQNNQLWAVLTAEQQSHLRRQIFALVNATWSQQVQPTVGARLWRRLPLRAGFQWGRFQLRRLLGQNSDLLGFQGAIASDTLVTRFLTDIQRLLPPEQLKLCLPSPGQLSGPMADPLKGPRQGHLANRANPELRLTVPGVIRGVASDLNTQSLVLVGDQNVLWDVLTPHQQGYLKQHIWLLVEAYWYWTHQTQRFGFGQQGLESLQFFHYLQQLVVSRFPGLQPLSLEASDRPDLPIMQLLAVAVQALAPDQKAKLQMSDASLLARLGQLFNLSALSNASSMAVPEADRVQGIATDLATHEIVLVGSNNQLWNLLTLSQQAYLNQQIWIWVESSVLHPGQGLSLKQQLVGQLPLSSHWKQFLLSGPTSKDWKHLLLDGVGIGGRPLLNSAEHREAGDQLDPIAWVQQQLGWQQMQARVSDLMESLPESAQRVLAPIEFVHQRLTQGVSVEALLNQLGQPKPLPRNAAAGTSAVLTDSPSASSLSQWPSQRSSQQGFTRLGLPESHYLEAEVTSFDYIEHPLEKLLRWLDAGLSWLEAKWGQLLGWFRKTF